jgi:hypothetical protein
LFPLTTTENPLMLDSLPHFFSSSIVVMHLLNCPFVVYLLFDGVKGY